MASWLQAMVHLYQSELQTLLHERDAVLARNSHTAGQRQVFFNNRKMHILCGLPISLKGKVNSLL